MKRHARKNCRDRRACCNRRNLRGSTSFQMIDTQSAEANPEFQTADAMKLITMQLNCEAVLFGSMEQRFCFRDQPRFLFDKDIDGCGKFASRHFGDQFLAYS